MRWLAALLIGVALSASGEARAQTPEELVRSLDTAQLEDLLAGAGFKILMQDTEGLQVSDGKSWPMRVSLEACENKTCSYLKLRTRFTMKYSKVVAEAADFYERTVPIAFVALETNKGVMSVDVGRDVFVAPGRTRANLEAELGIAVQIADAFRASMIKANPRLAKSLESPNAQN